MIKVINVMINVKIALSTIKLAFLLSRCPGEEKIREDKRREGKRREENKT
jgi:hypothetical protein